METTFGDWLQSVLDERGWKQADLMREAGLGKGSLSDIFSGRRNPGPELATAIADALGLPQELVYRKAGILRPERKFNPEVAQIIHEVKDLSKEEQLEFLSYIRWRNNQRKNK